MKNKGIFLTMLLPLAGIGVFSLLSLLLVDDRSQSFWITYAFTVVAFILTACIRLSFSTDRYSQTSGVWTYPIMICGAAYLIAQIAVAIIMMVSSASVKVAVIIQVLLLVAYGITVLLVSVAKKSAETEDREKIGQTESFELLAKEAESLFVVETDEKKKKYYRRIFEAIRYSDYVSNTAELQQMDEEIAQSLSFLNMSEQFEDDAEALLRLIAKRNVVRKSSKT